VVIKDLIGESGTALKLASESLDRVRAGMANMLWGGGSSGGKHSSNSGLYGDTSSGLSKDIISVILTDLRSVLSAKPGSTSLTSVASGILRSIPVGANKVSTEEARVQWEVDAEKVLRESLLLLFVYLFGEVDDLVVQSALQNTAVRSSQGLTSKSSATSAFSAGDSRSAFNLNTLWQRRAQQDSKNIQDFLELFQHSQLFERFCDERLKKLKELQVRLQAQNANAKKSGFGSSTGLGSQWSDEEDAFDMACAEIRNRRVSITVSTAKQVLSTVKQQQLQSG
jgi:hypothetical protein